VPAGAVPFDANLASVARVDPDDDTAGDSWSTTLATSHIEVDDDG
jgi:hypothetical protein